MSQKTKINKLYLVISTPLPVSINREKFRKEHFDYLSQLKKEGKLVLGGKFTGDKAGGMYILKCKSMIEATKLTHNDAYHKNKIRSFIIHELDQRL